MRLYRGDITKIYEKAIWPVGAVSEADGNVYKCVSIA